MPLSRFVILICVKFVALLEGLPRVKLVTYITLYEVAFSIASQLTKTDFDVMLETVKFKGKILTFSKMKSKDKSIQKLQLVLEKFVPTQENIF